MLASCHDQRVLEVRIASSECVATHLEVHIAIRRNEESLVLKTPLQLDDDGLARQLLHERLWIYRVYLQQ